MQLDLSPFSLVILLAGRSIVAQIGWFQKLDSHNTPVSP